MHKMVTPSAKRRLSALMRAAGEDNGVTHIATAALTTVLASDDEDTIMKAMYEADQAILCGSTEHTSWSDCPKGPEKSGYHSPFAGFTLDGKLSCLNCGRFDHRTGDCDQAAYHGQGGPNYTGPPQAPLVPKGHPSTWPADLIPKLRDEAPFQWEAHVKRLTEAEFKLMYRLSFDAFNDLAYLLDADLRVRDEKQARNGTVGCLGASLR